MTTIQSVIDGITALEKMQNSDFFAELSEEKQEQSYRQLWDMEKKLIDIPSQCIGDIMFKMKRTFNDDDGIIQGDLFELVKVAFSELQGFSQQKGVAL